MRPSWPQGRSVPRGWLSQQSRSSEKLGRKWEKRMCDTSKIIVVIGKKMRFLMNILLLFYCFYFEFTGPGREQRICQSSGLQGPRASAGQRKPLPAPSLGSTPIPPASLSLLTAPPPPAWHSKPLPSPLSLPAPQGPQAALLRTALTAPSPWTPCLSSSWGSTEAARPVLDAAGPQSPALAPTPHLACSPPRFPRPWSGQNLGLNE